MTKVYFVGAGPGDPELITIKGYKLIKEADVIIYAGSLVNPEVMNERKKEAKIFDSASMSLEEIISIMVKSIKNNKNVVRLHTGDASLYGAISEQINELNKKKIDYEVIPGVSSFLAAAASLKKEYTIPGGTQTVILTRLEGRTPVPERERLENLSKHKASMAIFLSVHNIDKVVEKLLKNYEKTTPAAVVQKASWHDEIIVEGKLSNISEKVKENGIKKTALILIGDFLGRQEGRSKLYDPTFTHEYREGSK